MMGERGERERTNGRTSARTQVNVRTTERNRKSENDSNEVFTLHSQKTPEKCLFCPHKMAVKCSLLAEDGGKVLSPRRRRW